MSLQNFQLIVSTNCEGVATFGDYEKGLFREMIAQFKNAIISIKVERYFDKRTTAQNRYYWFILNATAFAVCELGDKVNAIDMHIFFKARFLPKKKICITSIEGEAMEIESIESSRNLDKNQFSVYINEIIEFASKYLNLDIPSLKDFKSKEPKNKKNTLE